VNLDIKKIIPHVIAILLFIGMSLAYFYPVVQGKKMQQQDIIQYAGMAKKQNDYREKTGEELYWTDNAYGGMPTYLLGARYPHSYIKSLDRTIRFLPRPADYLFLYFFSIYILLLIMKVDWRLSILGAIAFGFSTYFIIILGVGHNAKAHAIAYFPLVLSGILLAFQRKYVWGFLLTAVAMSLEIMAAHPQMTYYLMLLVAVLGLVYFIDFYKKKELPHFFKATEYSYGKMETFNLLMPRFMGGGNTEDFGTDSKAYTYALEKGIPPGQAREFVRYLPSYWGDQPIIAAPAYVGAVIVFLAFLGLFLVKRRAKWWLVGGILLSLLLSWGKNLGFLTDFMIDYFPLYSKFRAVSSMQVILELCIPILGILTLAYLFKKETLAQQQKSTEKLIYYCTAGFVAVILILLAFKSSLFDFNGVSDDYYRYQYSQTILGAEFMEIIKQDRAGFVNKDGFRAIILIVLTAGVLIAFLKRKLKENVVIFLIAALLLFDLISIARRYVNTEEFVSKAQFEYPYRTLQVDKQILQDKGHYRVFEPRLRLNNSRTAFFHNTLGGYHAAKPRQFQELYDFYLDYERKFEVTERNINILNMMNVRYIIKDLEGEQDQDGAGAIALKNPYPNGNAWFINKVNFVETGDDEMLSLYGLDTRNEVVFRSSQVEANIELVNYKPNDLKYVSENSENGFAVFSEIHYPYGWNAYVDGKLVPHYRVNYVLRGLEVPAGKHTIEFKFEPTIVEKGITISLISYIVLFLLILGGIYYEFVYKKKVAKA